MAASKTRTRDFSVVGLSYRCTTPQIEEWKLELPLKVKLEREPNNREDPNAISVSLDDNKVTAKGMKIGYLPRQVAEVFADSMDRGYVELAGAKLVGLDADAGKGELSVKVKKRIHRG
jgi:hypothetical protein